MIDFENKIILGDCLEFMKGIPDKSFGDYALYKGKGGRQFFKIGGKYI